MLPPKHLAIAVTLLFSGIGVVADYFLKVASTRENPWKNWEFFLGLVLYASTAFGWLFVMQHLKLAAVGILYTVAMLILLALVGYFGFGESLSKREWLGLIFAIASVLLMVTEKD
ncbi:MAG: EamA family transporter [Pirellula sp.]|jgi:drug/metabolite transporter (DMT)-like permease|nr:EamA family transporter [Planctomycetota bacterium]